MNITPINQNQLPPPADDYPESTMGHLLLQMGKLTPEGAERILQLQRKEGLLFGEAALKLRLVTEADIRHVLAIQFDYPCLPEEQAELSQQLIAAYQPYSPQAEALRALRNQLMLRWFNGSNKALAVMATLPGEGCSSLAANLAIVFSQLGENTLLVDADLRNPTQHTLFQLRERRGLSDILIGRAGLDVVSQVASLSNLAVLGAGTIPPNPQELLNRKSFKEFMRQAQGIYDVVIVDTSPAIGSADAQMVAMRCGGALLASRLDQTPLRDLTNVRDQLIVSDVQIVAAIVQ